MVPTELRESPIHGIGVFLLAGVKKGELIWRFDKRMDRTYSNADIEDLPDTVKRFIRTYAAFHKASGLWMLAGDHAAYFNHSDRPSTITSGGAFGDDVAASDLQAGAELTSDYRSICDSTKLLGKLSPFEG